MGPGGEAFEVIAEYTNNGKVPYLIVGDFNRTPQQAAEMTTGGTSAEFEKLPEPVQGLPSGIPLLPGTNFYGKADPKVKGIPSPPGISRHSRRRLRK